MGFQISGRCWPAIPGAGPYIPAWTVCGNELWRLGFDAPLKGLARGFTAHEIRSQLAPEIIAGSGQGPRNLLIAASDRPPPKADALCSGTYHQPGFCVCKRGPNIAYQ